MATDGHLNFDTKIDESGFNKGVKKLGRLGKTALTVVGGVLTGIVSAVGTGVAASVKVGTAFEAEMSKVSAISGATGDELGLLGEKAKEMGAKTKFSATESAQAMEYMAMAGWKTEDMLSGIEGVMNLAAASGEDLATTSDIVTDALTAFGMAASDSGHFADVLAAASSNANTNVGLMGETFKYVAPVAGALGYSAEDTALAIGLMANSGIKASQAGTSLRQILSRLVNPTNEVQSAMDELGISMTDSEGNIKSFDAVIGDLRNAFNDLSESEKAQMASAVGGQEAMSGLLAIVNASDDDFNKLKDSIYNCDGAAANMASTMQDNLQGQLTILKSSAEGLGIEIYESIQTPLKDLAKVGVESINSLTDAFKENGADGLIEAGSKIIANIVVGIVNSIPQVASMALHICGSIISAIIDSAPQMKEAGMNLIRFLVEGLGKLPGLTEILDFVQKIGDKLSEAAPELIQKGFELLQKVVEGIVSAIPILIAKVPQIISTFANIINDNFPTILMKGVQLLGQLGLGIIKAIPTLIANIPQIIQAIIDALMAFQWLNLGRNIIKGLCDGVKAMAGAAKTAGKNILDSIKNVFLNLPGTLANLGKSAIYNLGATISGLKSYAMSSALKIVSGIESALLQLPSKMISIGKNLVKGLWNGISDMTGWIISKIKGFGDSVLSGIKSFFGIHSPSAVFRDQIGKMLALGIGVGFEKNIPLKSMNAGLQKAVNSLKKDVVFTTSARSGKSVGEIKNNPVFGSSGGTDWDEWERRQRRINKERDSRPIYLGTNRIDRPLPKGAVPVW